MSDKDNKHLDQFNASLPLPVGDKPKTETENNAAADIIRKKIEAVYQAEPSAKKEAEEVLTITDHKLSKHQQFIFELTSKGQPMHEIQTAWHEYYSALTEDEKFQVWDEFYRLHPNISKYSQQPDKPGQAAPELTKKYYTVPANMSYGREVIKRLKSVAPAKRQRTVKKQSPLQSILFGLSLGFIVILVLLFGFFNERFIAPFIQPSRNVTNTPIISSTTPISKDPEVIIPKINVEIPVVYDIATTDDAQVEQGLESGVVHYADTALPGQNGNVVIVGHSSNNIFNPGKYKFAFVLLSRMEIGDTFYLQKDGVRYTYQIYDKRIVKPSDVSVMGPQSKTATATLITCDPPGTSTNRLVVTAEQIDPASNTNLATSAPAKLATETPTIPGNSPSLWSRLVKWLWY